MFLELHDDEESNSLCASILNIDLDYQAEQHVHNTYKEPNAARVIKWLLKDELGVRCQWERSVGSDDLPEITGRSERFKGEWQKGPNEVKIFEDTCTLGAFVEEVDGQLVLHDPMAIGVINAVGKENCKGTLEINAERIQHFKRRLVELGKTPEEVVIVLLNVDDQNGGQIAEALMPNTDWSEFWARGEIPFARGLAHRESIQRVLGIFDESASDKLRSFEGIAVVVVDQGVAEIFAT